MTDDDGRTYRQSRVTPQEADRERVPGLEPVMWKLYQDGAIVLVYRVTKARA